MYLFFDNVPSNPKAEIKLLNLPSPSEPGAGWCKPLHRGAENGLYTYIDQLENFDEFIYEKRF